MQRVIGCLIVVSAGLVLNETGRNRKDFHMSSLPEEEMSERNTGWKNSRTETERIS